MRSFYKKIPIFLLALACSADAIKRPKIWMLENGVLLGVPLVKQKCPVWCWAGVAEMVAAYHGLNYSQCQFATIKTANKDADCCRDGCSILCNQRSTIPDLMNLLKIAGINAEMSSELKEENLQAEISAGRPVIVLLLGPLFGHIVVVSGFRKIKGQYLYRVLDPVRGISEKNYMELSGDMENEVAPKWRLTLFKISPRGGR